MQPRHFEAVIFSAKAATAAVLVTQPNLHSTFQASLMRVIANLAGAFGGAALLVITGQPVVAMALGVMTTGLVCYFLKQDDALRPAFVAVIIVTLIGEHDKWHSSLDRVLAVIIGCVCALAVGFLFDKLADAFKLLCQDGPKKRGQQE